MSRQDFFFYILPNAFGKKAKTENIMTPKNIVDFDATVGALFSA